MTYHQWNSMPSKHRAAKVTWHWGKLVNRRLLGQIICRLPLLAFWSILVIFFLYKILSTSEIERIESIETTLGDNDETVRSQARYEFVSGQYSSDDIKQRQQPAKFSKSDLSKASNLVRANTPITGQPTPVVQLSTTKKSSLAEYARQGKVFILMIQNENLHPNPSRRATQETDPSHQQHQRNKNNHKSIIVPPHIRILKSILDSHRIEYDEDSTRSGIPTSLLTDQNNSSEKKQYSVIVIDDFLKYTQLNRWIRDQLDRHCRLNKIGVVTYFTSGAIEALDKSKIIGSKWERTTRSIKAILLNQTSFSQTSSSEIEESLTDQFPISFKVIDYNNSQCRKNTSTCLEDYQVNEMSPVLRILKRKPEFIIQGPLDDNVNQSPWISMSTNHISYEPLTWAKLSTNNVDENRLQENGFENDPSMMLDERQVLSMYDRGLFDGIKRVIFGGANHHWVDRILLLDSIEHLSSGRIFSPLDRFIQIDVDDIFVGEKGIRMKPEDVDYMIETQETFAKTIDGGFKFNLGFSGKYFKRGLPDEIKGDEELIAKANEFTWFCHTWAHTKSHLFDDKEGIANELRKNLKFAKENNIPIIGYANFTITLDNNQTEGSFKPATYAVAPHHSGVYPIHEQLYEAWLEVLNVQVTSTEEYPSLKPANGRRAFVHKTIKVLPRQTCGLYTHTIYRDKYPGGMEKLEASIRGGELFETVLHNPVNIYMTHMSNYANDRLAPYTFGALLEFISNNTNLILKYAPTTTTTTATSLTANQDRLGQVTLGPERLADHYFKLYPSETNPLWTNPCNDKRHLAIWAEEKHKFCYVVPKLLIVGPQKTGTTALYTFLKLNPLFKSSQMSSSDFEEIQFFNEKHYDKGVDWYFSRFLSTESEEENYNKSIYFDNDIIYFDKSSTYFDDPKVPQRAFNLLPEARIVILLTDPANRAYSWYQHIKAHGDVIANTISFEQIIMSKDDWLTYGQGDDSNSTRLAIRNLRNRCLHPGYYAQHLLSWLEYFPPRHVIIIDGEWFKHKPAPVMAKLQKLILRTNQPLDYEKLLVYNEEKGFYCERLPNQTVSWKPNVKCLGKGKGRKYPPMSQEARLFLNRHYWSHNRQLVRILSDIGQPVPDWLEKIIDVRHKAIY